MRSADGRAPLQSHNLLLLDLLRAGSALLVLAVHARSGTWVDFDSLPQSQQTLLVAIFFAVTRLGTEAVVVFFVLSGLLVGGRLITTLLRGSFQLRLYVIDRTTRILIPLVPACLLAAAVGLVFYGDPGSPGMIVGNMVGLNGVLVGTLPTNAPLWSLAYEIWFYVLGAAIALLASRRHVGWAVVLIGVTAVVFTRLSPSFLLCWALGAFSVFLLVARPGQTVILALVGVAVAAAGAWLNQIATTGIEGLARQIVSPSTAAVILALGIALTMPMLCRPKWNAFLAPAAGLIRRASAFSYTLYLVHWPVNSALGQLWPLQPEINSTSVVIFIGRITICVLFSAVMYWLFEHRTLAVRRYIQRLVSNKNAVVTES